MKFISVQLNQHWIVDKYRFKFSIVQTFKNSMGFHPSLNEIDGGIKIDDGYWINLGVHETSNNE